MSKRTWIVFTVIVIGLMTALIISSRSSSPKVDVNSIDANLIQAATEASGNIADHVFGKADSKVILIEYGDFQCPACAAAYSNTHKVTGEYQNQIAYIFRNFPLTTIHANALAASAIAEAAGLQGKYWEMHDLIYESHSSWENLSGTSRTDAFVSYGASLGLDTDKLVADAAASNISQKISFDQALGKKIGVNATPTFYLDGVQLSGDIVQDIQQGNGDLLRNAFNSELQKVGVTPPVVSQ